MMRAFKLKTVVCAALLAVAGMLTGCDSMDETNTDPTRMRQAGPGNFLVPTLYNMAVYNWNRYNGFTFPLMQGIVSTSSTTGTGWYNITDAAGDGTWSTYYRWLNNANTIYELGVATNTPNYQAVGLTLQAWILQLLADSFGDIPVDEAARANEGLLTPKFNTQAEAYQAVLSKLAIANTLFNEKQGLVFNHTGDMMFCSGPDDTGGITKWRKFANSLRLRALLRVIDVPGLHATDSIEKMMANPAMYPVMTSNAESASVSISGIAPEEQPVPRLSDFTSYKVLSAFFVDKLKAWKDPRLAIWATKVKNNGVSDYYGMPSGYKVMPAMTASAPHANNIAKAPMKLNLMTYAEVLFIQAELAHRANQHEAAKAFYEQGVKASVEQWGATLPANYFNNAEAAYDNTLKRIMEQKFYALFFVDYQQWFEYNRTGYPEVPVGDGVEPGRYMPRRFKYPSILQRANMDNYRVAREAMGGDELNIKLIWQK